MRGERIIYNLHALLSAYGLLRESFDLSLAATVHLTMHPTVGNLSLRVGKVSQKTSALHLPVSRMFALTSSASDLTPFKGLDEIGIAARIAIPSSTS